jgi:general secretion pathway protein A
MYNQFFGLTKDPFSMTPDPAFLFLTAPHREALAGLTYSILNRKGFVVLTGDAGTGKTTLLSRIFQSIPSTRARFSVVLNPTLTPSEFLELALLDFGVTNIPTSKAQRLTLLQQFLIEAHKKRQVAVLVVDEAHKLPPDVLEEIRLLSNFELAETKLLQIVLAGQTELGDMLNRQDLRQLKQRIAVRLAIHPLSATGVEHYIQHRWQRAGSTQPHPFQADAVARIAEYSRGIPRLVNAICDNALMLAYAEGQTAIGAAQVVEVAGDLDLLDRQGRPSRPATEAPSPARPKIERNPNPASAGNGRVNGVAPGTGPAPLALPTLYGYQSDTSKPSRLMRLAGKLGLSNKRAS